MFHHMPHTSIPADFSEMDVVKPNNVAGFVRFVPGESPEFVSIESGLYAEREQEITATAARLCLNAQLETAVQ